jgi:endoglucanase
VPPLIVIAALALVGPGARAAARPIRAGLELGLGAGPGKGRAVAPRFGVQSSGTAPSTAGASSGTAPSTAGATSPLAGLRLYVDPNSAARAQADTWRTTRPGDAALLDRIAERPQAVWLGGWSGDVKAAVARQVAAARAAGAVPELVAYNIPNRDCGGGQSAGGAPDAASYGAWIDAFATGIGDARAIVILEPDALADIDCLSQGARGERLGLLADAVARLSAQPGTLVYLDAGNPSWHPADEMARRLAAAGVARARGFALNVSNFFTTAANLAYGRAISALVGGKPFVVDTSRNGAGPSPDGAWCNPPGRALGSAPTVDTGQPEVDAYLWVKRPGESDGTCGGGPPAGQFWPEYALGLAQRATG